MLMCERCNKEYEWGKVCPDCHEALTLRSNGLEAESNPALEGIAGWLILPAIGLVVTPILSLISVARFVAALPDTSSTQQLITYALSALVGGGLIIWTWIIAYHFFKRHRCTPQKILWLLIAQVPAALVLLLAWLLALTDPLYYGQEVMVPTSIGNLIGAIVALAIWAPYFARSKRVQFTFVK